MVRTRAPVNRRSATSSHAQDYVEIETPVLQLIHGGAAARPFRTHLNAFQQDMTLRIALELNLKKAVVGGVDRVYELGRIFRNEGVDATHSPEFTMLEAYQAYGDQTTIAGLIRDLYLAVADALGSRQVETPRGVVDLDGPWRWLPVYDAASARRSARWSPSRPPLATLQEYAAKHDVAVDPAWHAEKVATELFGELVEPTLLQPTFLCDYPAVGAAAGPAAPQRPAADRGVGPHHRRGRARHRVLRAGRPGGPARGPHRPVPARGRRRRGGHAAGRGLPAGPGVRRTADGRAGARHGPAGHVVHRRRTSARPSSSRCSSPRPEAAVMWDALFPYVAALLPTVAVGSSSIS